MVFISIKEGDKTMPVDPQAQVFLDMLKAMNVPDVSTQTVEEARAVMEASRQLDTTPPEAIFKVENRTIPGPAGEIPVRIYTPEGNGPLPVLVYFHGGGWVICSLDTHDGICRALANQAQCVVVSVDYRMAPEHKFPAAVDDCYAATKWVVENAASINGKADRVAVGGDSAGGNLAAVVSLMAKENGGPHIVFQLLIYPATDYYIPGTDSIRENAEGYYLTRSAMVWFWNHYANSEEDANNPHMAPLRAKDLSNLPPALVLTAEYDPLRDEGEMYATRLQEAGVSVTATRYNGMVHGFFSLSNMMDQAKVAVAEAAAALRVAFG
jgi:acetyl esterase